MDPNLLSLFVWTPLDDMEIADKLYGEELGLNNYWAKWGMGQLLYLKKLKPLDLGKYVDFERMNWDSKYAMDFATLTSIMRTNFVSCLSWKIFKKLFKIYRKSWKTRFLISLGAEALGTPGYIGVPLYYSEFFGDYPPSFIKQKEEAKAHLRSGFKEFKRDFHSGMSLFEAMRRPRYADPIIFHEELDLLKTIEKQPSKALGEMTEAIISKLSHEETQNELIDMMDSEKWHLVFPYLLEGSYAYASYRKLEKMGGMKRVISKSIPDEIKDELYIMSIACSAKLFYLGQSKKYKYDDIFKRIRIKKVVHFGGDTSIKISPLFAFLKGELGHYKFDAFLKEKSSTRKHKVISEVIDAMNRNHPKMNKLEPELSFDRLTNASPPEMLFVIREEQMSPKRSSEFILTPEFVKKLREEDFE